VSGRPALPRLRHLALVADDLETTSAALREALGLGVPYTEDPLAPQWGVRNAVFALGDQFLEVISPLSDDAPAARHLKRRRGDGGYMVMFQVPDVAAARARARAEGVRIVWEHDGPDMSGTHLHPADLPGAIVSLDASTPPQAWRWAGPGWVGRAGEGATGAVLSATVAVVDPAGVAARWAQVLGVGAVPDVRFLAGEEGLSGIELALPDQVRAGRDEVRIGGVRFALRPL
jgi:catechol 2,3-dioxygenase-like lactoylglutathione lyase family enzyme